MTQRGKPGGCATPVPHAARISSPLSTSVTVGASVNVYSSAATTNPCFARALHLQYREMKQPLRVAVLAACLTTGILAQPSTPASSPAQPPADYDLRWGVKIPTRDNVELNATLYLPKKADGSR